MLIIVKNSEIIINLDIYIRIHVYAGVARELYIPVGQRGPVFQPELAVRWQEGTSVPGTASLDRESALWKKPCVPSYVFGDRHSRPNLKKKYRN